MNTAFAHDFNSWRNSARQLLALKAEPHKISWNTSDQGELFGLGNTENSPATHAPPERQVNVSQQFIQLAKTCACFRDDSRWALLYRALWRLTHGEKNLLAISTDDDIHRLRAMEKEVRRDCHKMKAFVRFRKTDNGDYVAWYQPSHYSVTLTAPFFARRFSTMNFAILTPDCSAYWNQKTLSFGEGLSREHAPKDDELEDLWKTFYRHIFNPARIKIKMMKSEMPVKFWHTLPEAELIKDMLSEAPSRVRKMIADGQPKAIDK